MIPLTQMVAAPEIGIHACGLEKEGWELDRCLDWTRRQGVRFFEIGPQMPRGCRQGSELRRMLDRHGIILAAREVNPVDSTAGALDEPLRWAVDSGCGQLLVAGVEHGGEPGMEQSGAVNLYRRIATAGERHGVVISIDVAGALADQGRELAGIMEKIDSGYLRVSIDGGRVRAAGADPLAVLAQFEGRIGHVRIRAATGDTASWLDMRSMVELLVDAGYGGAIGIIDEGGRGESLARRIAEVRQTLAAWSDGPAAKREEVL